MKQTFLSIIITFLMMAMHHAEAAVDVRSFSSPSLAERYQILVHELRCPKCQNQTIGDSDAPIAADLRQEVATLLEQGKSDEEIQQYLVARFGEFVLYRPRVESRTYLLWSIPIVFLLLGVGVLIWLARQGKKQLPAPLNEAESARLDALLSPSVPEPKDGAS